MNQASWLAIGIDMRDSLERFSSRVENYVRFRPRYPRQILEPLITDCGLTPQCRIADIGSGTGFLAELFLACGNRVFGVEPNAEMRQAGERLLALFPNFMSIAGTAEATTLPEHSVDLVTAGQAFHWFDRARCRAEFERILVPGGWIVLVWNERRTDSTPFLAEYEHLLRFFGTDYAQVDHKQIDSSILHPFFGCAPVRKTFPNTQEFDFPGLQGRLLSSSYIPEAGQPRYAEMLSALKELFQKYQRDGKVLFEYDTVMYYGRLL